MPPTANKQLIMSRGRFIKATEARVFDNNVLNYILRNRKIIEEIRIDLLKYIDKGLMLRVDTYFCFEYQKLITKEGKPKTIDTNNRIKATLDAVSKAIGIDDKYFSQGYSEKVVRCTSSNEDHSIILIEPTSQIVSEETILTTATIPLRSR